jgi:A1 cistron-splicing factor AAR2
MDSDNWPILLMLDLPPAAFCGIDLISFTSSAKFRGIKEIPPGWHFVYTGATSVLSIRHGTWFYAKPALPSSGDRDVIIKKWNAEREELVDESDETEILRWRANLGSIWAEGLSPYTQNAVPVDEKDAGKAVEENNDWSKMISCINPTVLKRITRGEPNNYSLTSASCFEDDKEEIPGITHDDFEQSALYFLPIDLKNSWPSGAVGRERTLAAQDRSYLLGHIIQTQSSKTGSDVIGEFQFAFLMILTLNNYSCMEQWKRIFQMFLTSKVDIRKRHLLFSTFLETLKMQLKHCDDAEGGLFDFADEGGALLRNTLMGFKRGMEDEYGEDGPPDVEDAFEDFESFVNDQYGWSFSDSYVRSGLLELEDGEKVDMELNDLEGEDERGEYAPTVVDLGDTDLSKSENPG